jgi:RNA polymerase sigma factor (sigma-70 family)
MENHEHHEELRPYLFAIAYRMLGSVAEAEDVVQETFLRYHEAGVEPESPKAYLATVTTRLAIDQLRSARARGARSIPASGCPSRSSTTRRFATPRRPTRSR